MKNIRHILSALTVLLIVVMAAGTIVEKYHGSEFAISHVYGTWWFIALWALAAVSMGVMLVLRKAWRQPVVFTLHLSVLLILLGALLTKLTGQHGEMTLQPGVANDHFQIREKNESREVTLPFSLTLDHFDVVTHPGTRSPSDFVSHLHITDDGGEPTEAIISMNNILKHKNYRFYQNDYDEKGNSVLSVSHDPWGIGVTYAGYLLLLGSLVALFIVRNSKFRLLLKKTSAKAALLLSFMVIGCGTSAFSANLPRTLPKESADKMGQMYVQYKGRLCSLQTLAKDFTTKLCGNAHYRGLTPEQVFSGWVFYYNDWKDEPIFKIKGKNVQKTLGINGNYAKLADFIDTYGVNKLDEVVVSLPMGDPKRKEYLMANEKFNLIQMLYNGELLKMFPHADSSKVVTWYSQSDELPLDISEIEYLFIRKQLSLCQEYVVKGDFAGLNEVFVKTKIYQEKYSLGQVPSKAQYRAERLYNRLTAGKWLAMVTILMGIIFFAIAIFNLGKGRELNRHVRRIAVAWTALLSTFLALLFVLRWIAGGHVPMAGSFDSMNLLALSIGIITLLLIKRHEMALPAGMLMMGFVLLVQMMGGSNPPVTHLMPVLTSPLLSLHVTVIMIAYALLFFIMLNGITAIFIRLTQRQKLSYMERLQDISQLLLYPAVALLAAGIFIGAVWANISWGTYWSWDPKEVWALITLMVYLFPLHSQQLPIFQKPTFYHLYTILAFLSVLITYFGVNLILGGMHSYA
ncbi:MAG: cytochrome c biogenesis protein CcsA [Bacteroidales bacterium]|nr:cytochrome c biogenesis protein CcsA [Bacteroidales bacterium]